MGIGVAIAVTFSILLYTCDVAQDFSDHKKIVYIINSQGAESNNCSNRSTSTIFGPGGDITISYQFLEGVKMGSLCGGHIGQIQPPSGVGHFNNFRTKSVLNINYSTFVGLWSMGNPFLMLFYNFKVHHVIC